MTIKEYFIKREGCERKPYLDNGTPRKWTIGIGVNFSDNPFPKPIKAYLDEYGEITEEMIDQLFDTTIATAFRDCHDLFPDFDTFSENRRTALVDVVFNMGKGRISHSFPSFVHNINREAWQDAADDLKYVNGRKKTQLSKYWLQLHGERHNSRPAEVYEMIREG
jgi:GH24 family phage-related lysozyme (muramidase)